MNGHKERAHSKFSASGSERWLQCSASVALSEQAPPSPDTEWSLEGTKAHELFEHFLKVWMKNSFEKAFLPFNVHYPEEMVNFVSRAAEKCLDIKNSYLKSNPDFFIEERVYLDFINPEMFGTIDVAIVDLFGDLHVLDLKYGRGHIVNPTNNTQLIFYALGFAHKFDWNFQRVHLHVLQPRSPRETHLTWSITLNELRAWVPIFEAGVKRITSGRTKYFPGNWCFFCPAKTICPALEKKKFEQVIESFD